MLGYIINSLVFLWLGSKLQKAINLYREVRDIKKVESIVKKVLSKDKISIIQNKEEDVLEEDKEYQEYLKFKSMKEGA